MSAISIPRRFAEPRRSEVSSSSFHDVTASVRLWGRRGIFLGGTFGFALAAVFVAIPLSTNVLTFGAIGTLLVGAVECAVIAGGFAALGAAIFASGVRGDSAAQDERILRPDRRFAVDVPLAEWPTRRAYRAQPTVQLLPRDPDKVVNKAFELADARARLATIDAWENGNAGP